MRPGLALGFTPESLSLGLAVLTEATSNFSGWQEAAAQPEANRECPSRHFVFISSNITRHDDGRGNILCGLCALWSICLGGKGKTVEHSHKILQASQTEAGIRPATDPPHKSRTFGIARTWGSPDLSTISRRGAPLEMRPLPRSAPPRRGRDRGLPKRSVSLPNVRRIGGRSVFRVHSASKAKDV
jgi:hypothetical protein